MRESLGGQYDGSPVVNLLTNPSAETSSGSSTVVWTNEFTNPAMQGVVSGTTFKRTNLCGNPSFEGGATTGWSGKGNPVSTISLSSTRSHSGTSCVTVVNATNGQTSAVGYNATGLVVGAKYTMSAWVYVPSTNTGSTTACATVSSIGYGTYSSATNTWVRLYMTITATSANHQFGIDFALGAAIGDQLFVDDMLIEQTDQLRPYFDGSATLPSGWATAWSGTANASTSIASCSSIVTRSNICANPSFEINSTGWSGGNASGTIATSTAQVYVGSQSLLYTASSTPGADNGPQYSFAAVSGTTYTASIWVYQTSLFTTSGIRFAAFSTVNSTWITTSAWTTTVGAWARLSITFTASANGNIILVTGNPSSGAPNPSAGTTLYVDALLIEPNTSLTSTYFDGNTLSSGDFNYGWTGTSGASTSQQIAATTAGVYTAGVTSHYWSGWNSSGNQVTNFTTQGAIVNNGTNRILFGGALTLSTVYTYVITMYATQAGSWVIGSDSVGDPLATLSVTTTPTTFTFQFNSPTTGTYGQYNYGFLRPSNNPALNSTITITNLTIVSGVYAGVPFDGTTTTANDITYAWTGTPHASTSTGSGTNLASSGFQLANSGNNTCALIQSTTAAVAGSYSLRIMPLSNGTDTSVYIYGGAAASLGGFVPGRTYTAIATITLLTAQVSSVETRARSIAFANSVDGWTLASNRVNAPNTPGTYQLRLVFKVPINATWANLRIYNGATGGNDVYWDAIMLVEGNYNGPYIDGDQYGGIWTGTPHNSRSKGTPPSPKIFTNINNTAASWMNSLPTTSVSAVGIAGRTTSLNTATASITRNNVGPYTVSRINVMPLTTYTAALWIRSSRAVQMRARIEEYSINGGGILNITPGPVATLVPGQWTRYVCTVTTLASTLSITPTCYTPNSDAWAINDTIEYDRWVIVQGSSMPDYFDGSFPGGKWTGTAGASSSYAYAPSLNSFAGAPLLSLTNVNPSGGNKYSFAAQTDGVTIYSVQYDTNSSPSNDGYWQLNSGIYRAARLMSIGTSTTQVQAAQANTQSAFVSTATTQALSSIGIRTVFATRVSVVPNVKLRLNANNGALKQGSSIPDGYTFVDGIYVGSRDGAAAPIVTDAIIVYSGIHTDTQVSAITTYLSNKYGA